ncbi:MAG: MGMT family protein [Clostridiales bacterium]|nr:MGMT family protein [Clostridiales bacterium]
MNYEVSTLPKKNFYEKVYAVVMQIPEGKVATYGQIAMLCGSPKAARAVGYALHVNPSPGIIPCHRIVNREGGLAKSFAFGGIDRQKELLEKEGVKVDIDTVDLKVFLWDSSNFILE